MWKHHRLVSALLTSLLASACATTEGPEPPRSCETHTLKFKVKNDGCVEKVQRDTSCDCDADAVIVHRCDKVVWLVTGKGKSVNFDKGDGTPLEWKDSGNQGARIEGTVKADAKDKPYRYTVRTEGACPLDPMIIVQP